MNAGIQLAFSMYDLSPWEGAIQHLGWILQPSLSESRNP